MQENIINCEACRKDLIPSGSNGKYRKTQRFCGPKCARSKQEIKYTSIDDRLKKKIKIHENGCWEFTGSKGTNGYGRIRGKGLKGKLHTAHVYTYVKKYGTVPDGLELDHLCRNRWCCNPDHLEAVSHKINFIRGMAPTAIISRSGKCKRGHEFNENNTYRYKKGKRIGRVAFCRVCRNERRRSSSIN